MARPADWTPLGCDTDPVPGDPQAVGQESARLAKVADEASRQSAALRKIAATAAGPELKGKFATQTAEAATGISRDMNLVAIRYTKVSKALAAWSPVLEQAQQMSLRALDMAWGPYRLLQNEVSPRAQAELDDARAL